MAFTSLISVRTRRDTFKSDPRWHFAFQDLGSEEEGVKGDTPASGLACGSISFPISA